MERALTGLSKLASRKSTKDFSQLAGGKEWPMEASAYQILDDCGRGVSATVHRARCSNGAEVAVKLMNLESMNCDLDEIIHEAQTMRMYNHPNILPLYCSFVNAQELWMVMPFVSGGSVLHIMKYAHPEGLDEVVIATIGREVLKGLDYVHKNGSIHRDVKAGNILVDGDGNVKVGDFGVAASLERGGSWGHDKQARMTFVGTPCWMAPEVMEQTVGYDFSADIWSFGITLLEMCHGHAPFAKFPPMKVLLMTLQNPAPTLEDKGKRHFSKALKDLVTRCLQKERDKRPTAAQLLEHKFFKIAKDAKYLKENLVGGLPALADRVNRIRNGMAATNVHDNDRNLEKSQARAPTSHLLTPLLMQSAGSARHSSTECDQVMARAYMKKSIPPNMRRSSARQRGSGCSSAFAAPSLRPGVILTIAFAASKSPADTGPVVPASTVPSAPPDASPLALPPPLLARFRRLPAGALGLPAAAASAASALPCPRSRDSATAPAPQIRPLSKAPSLANLGDAKDGKSRSDGGGSLLGKPPTAPTSLMTSVSVVLPKLQELLDHSAAHQAALQKLIGAVQECDKGRVPLLLSRAQSTRSLFDGTSLGGEATDDLQRQIAELRSRLASVEDENCRLKERNTALEGRVQEALNGSASSVRFAVPEPNSSLASLAQGGASSPTLEPTVAHPH
ncbi:Serine/threonine-protein kinase OSR1 [Tetrabaena socialis]|uniref:Serine/threonine-protein kinase OSR1 n=1 Tax=Tetrabaena socialis TaxID=47790 RepID=A0A2J8A8Y6_9CHLO|nr:Serine/threonine-protein kinase OSR1 [Tetrabaena socialis]|eukprot:PNH08988.1 Serine/threonine-protein kinase OSR1 [Tetrabaena socialis]